MQPRPQCGENDHTSNSVNCIANILSSQWFLILTIVLLVFLLKKERLMYQYIVMWSVKRSKLDVQLRGQQIVR